MNSGMAFVLLVVGVSGVGCSAETTSSSELDSMSAESVVELPETTETQVTGAPAVVERVGVTLNWPGSGGGNVVADPPLLACGATSGGVQSCTFPKGVEVALSAEPLPGSRFIGWGGACEEAGSADTCVVTFGGETTIDVFFD